MSNPSITALITIRENDIRYFPTYDFRMLGGKTLYRHMLDRLLAVPHIGRIVVITDSEQIRSECAANGKLQTVDYPTTFSEDENERRQEQLPWSDRMTAHALEQVDGEHFIQVQCGTPFLAAESLKSAIERYYSHVLGPDYDGAFDSVMSLGRVERKRYSSANYPKVELYEDPPFIVFEDAVLNIFCRTAFRKNGNKKFGRNPMFFEVREIENLCIETDDSLALAEVIWENRARFPFIHQG